jgi:hypothetical protein
MMPHYVIKLTIYDASLSVNDIYAAVKKDDECKQKNGPLETPRESRDTLTQSIPTVCSDTTFKGLFMMGHSLSPSFLPTLAQFNKMGNLTLNLSEK